MLRAHRRVHQIIWQALAVVLPLAVLALLALKPDPSHSTQPQLHEAPPDTRGRP